MKLLFTLLCFLGFNCYAQKTDSFPKNYFINPLEIPISLAGNFGEFRPNHFHTGIDLKTNQRENLRVLAAADGYISRVVVSHSGYGNALYVAHPNGYTTVYAHLNDFYPLLQDYVRLKQYDDESWQQDFVLPSDSFSVKKGDWIAYSGNTGGSTAPHLHFEIRNTLNGYVYNTMLFGLPIKDKIAPVAKRLAIYNSSISIYEQDPNIYSLNKSGSSYRTNPDKLMVSSPRIKLGIYADDYMDGSANILGVYKVTLKMDGAIQFESTLNEIDFNYNRHMNAFADYKLQKDKKIWYQSLFKLPANQLNVFTYLNQENGSLDISDAQPHKIEVLLEDASGNKSVVDLIVQYQKNVSANDDPIKMVCKEGGDLWQSEEGGEVSANTLYLKLAPLVLYDDICFTYSEVKNSKAITNEVQLYRNNVPIHSFSKLGLKLHLPLPFKYRTKLAFVHHIKAANLPGNNPQSGMAARYENGWAVADVRTFGSYYAVIDTIPPVIKRLEKVAKNQISFIATDQITSVKRLDGYVNGKWVCFVRKGNTYIYTFDEYCPKGTNRLLIRAFDENENEAQLSINFERK